METNKPIIEYFPVVEDKEKTQCTFCNKRSPYRTFRNGRMRMEGNIYYIKMCRECFLKAKHNPNFCKKIYWEIKKYAGK